MEPNSVPLGRREFLKGALAVSMPLLNGSVTNANARAEDSGKESGPSPGLILRERDPENMEFPFCGLDRFITPNDKHFIRSHFAAPAIEAKTWRLRIEGAVEKPLVLSLDDIKALPSQKQVVLLECAGNGRGFLVPKVTGVNWELGAVGTADGRPRPRGHLALVPESLARGHGRLGPDHRSPLLPREGP
jgi:DMSO/TMAO reductase YedYZ molybdopterin-dependent catalytic subunit